MLTRIKTRRDGLALYIPNAFAEKMGLQAGSMVEISLEDGKLVIAPAARQKSSLDDLLDHITLDNLHGEIAAGPAVGNEVW